MAPGTNIGDYLPVDAHFDPLEVDEHKYRYGYPLVRPGHPPLTTMMRRLHEWYMEFCKSSGIDSLLIQVKEEQDLVVIELLCVPFEELFQLYNQMAIDKVIVPYYCL